MYPLSFKYSGVKMVIWLIGLSGAGKSTIGKLLYQRMKLEKPNTIFLDGDEIRKAMGNDLGYSLKDRKLNADRICRFCQLFESQDIEVVCSILSLFPESRSWNRLNLKQYLEVFIDVPLEVLKERDPKGIYQKAAKGEASNVAGVDLPFKKPQNPHLTIVNHGPGNSIGNAVEQITRLIQMQRDRDES